MQKADVLGKVELNFHTRHSSKALLVQADDDSSSDDEDQDKEEDELFKKRMEWRSELNQDIRVLEQHFNDHEGRIRAIERESLLKQRSHQV